MQITAICDLWISKNFMENGLESLTEHGAKVSFVEWLKNEPREKMQEINLMIENSGVESIEPTPEVFEACENADIIITHFCTVTKKLIDSCKNLKIICVLRGGTENINIEYANEKNILCINTPGRTANAVADFTIGMILAETRNISRCHCDLKKGIWHHDYTNAGQINSLTDKIVGLIGLGEIGKSVAKRLSGFGVSIIGFDPYSNQAELSPLGITLVSLEYLLQTSDIVSIHSRLTDDTFHMIGKNEIDQMKSGAYLINISRSGLVDEDALYIALKEKKIMGAALDVFNVEPTSADYPIVTLDNVTITPHIAGSTNDTMTGSPKILTKNLLSIFEGKAPKGSINIDRINFDFKLLK